MCSLDDFKHLQLDSYHSTILKNELEVWHKTRLPLKRKNVLDIGAGNGETAQFYLNHGAEHVLSVEPFADLLKANFGDDPRVTIWPFAADFICSDCEGGEHNMLIEIHFPYRWKKHTIGNWPDRVTVLELQEYWGNTLRKVARILATRILGPLYRRLF